MCSKLNFRRFPRHDERGKPVMAFGESIIHRSIFICFKVVDALFTSTGEGTFIVLWNVRVSLRFVLRILQSLCKHDKLFDVTYWSGLRATRRKGWNSMVQFSCFCLFIIHHFCLIALAAMAFRLTAHNQALFISN